MHPFPEYYDSDWLASAYFLAAVGLVEFLVSYLLGPQAQLQSILQLVAGGILAVGLAFKLADKKGRKPPKLTVSIGLASLIFVVFAGEPIWVKPIPIVIVWAILEMLIGKTPGDGAETPILATGESEPVRPV